MQPPPLPSQRRFPLIGKILLTGTAIILLPVIAYYIAAATGTARMYRMPTGAMKPTLQPGDVIFAVRYSPAAADLPRGEMVIFDATGIPFAGMTLEDVWPQRITAIPGDTVSIKDGLLLVNDTAIDRNGHKAIAPSNAPGARPLEYPLVVPPGHVFLLGDNFQNSLDSRYFGPVAIKRIKYRPTRLLAPSERAGKIE